MNHRGVTIDIAEKYTRVHDETILSRLCSHCDILSIGWYDNNYIVLSFNMYVSISAAPTKEDSDTDQELLKLLKDAWMEHQVAG